ncbi:MAG: hypothetical protein AAF989_05845 [Planctomycetota bacterium]
MKLNRNLQLLAAFAGLMSIVSTQQTAAAVDGTELNATVGLWAPLLPDLEVGSTRDSSDELGGIVGLSGHHRFDGYRTSVEAGVFYGDAGDISLFGYEALLRDTWEFGLGDFSAGFGYSALNYEQDYAGANLDSDYQGAKVVAGWETMFGRQPLWIDLGLGLYDMDGTYTAPAGAVFENNTFATTYSVALKTETCLWGIAARPTLKFEYLSDIATFQGGNIGTDDAVVLSAMIEFRLANLR